MNSTMRRIVALICCISSVQCYATQKITIKNATDHEIDIDLSLELLGNKESTDTIDELSWAASLHIRSFTMTPHSTNTYEIEDAKEIIENPKKYPEIARHLERYPNIIQASIDLSASRGREPRSNPISDIIDGATYRVFTKDTPLKSGSIWKRLIIEQAA